MKEEVLHNGTNKSRQHSAIMVDLGNDERSFGVLAILGEGLSGQVRVRVISPVR